LYKVTDSFLLTFIDQLLQCLRIVFHLIVSMVLQTQINPRQCVSCSTINTFIHLRIVYNNRQQQQCNILHCKQMRDRKYMINMDIILLFTAIVFFCQNRLCTFERQNITICNYLHIPSRNKVSSDIILLKQCLVDRSATSVNDLYKVGLQ